MTEKKRKRSTGSRKARPVIPEPVLEMQLPVVPVDTTRVRAARKIKSSSPKMPELIIIPPPSAPITEVPDGIPVGGLKIGTWVDYEGEVYRKSNRRQFKSVLTRMILVKGTFVAGPPLIVDDYTLVTRRT